MSRVEGTRGGPVARFSAWVSKRMYGKVTDPILVAARQPGVLRGYVAFEYALSRAGRVDWKLKELAALKAAAVAGCEYCLDIGSAAARKHGATREQVAELHRHRESEHFSELERMVLDYAAAMSSTPCEVPDELFESLRGHFDDGQLVELTAHIAFENYRARFNWAVEIEPQGFCHGACAIPEHVASGEWTTPSAGS